MEKEVPFSLQSGNYNKVLTVVGVYHPPNTHLATNANAVFIMEFFNLMCDLQLECKNIMILVDFNLHIDDKSDPDTQ